ncbi:6,7-dimethyl-8-ribityllumazine synthase [Xylaria bambusicola]|uniref:6,7-dimethyl-8-ribityllumazine synthase n=1 Tax=Xylaria bambusicola TaxID=326684 RepID=UPI0020085BAB|nr:6,7-dimethyl-8-ribityllumazine synthase [Xylaria bambusicola]KAI0523812.1 6,7-dimethyl-8-ribityllumazine synthase [Xylaria bambusicola]
MASHSLKGPKPEEHDGSALRIGIVHARWNETIIAPLLEGTKAQLAKCGVKDSNIVVQSVPGSWELPIAVQRMYTASQIQQSSSGGASTAGDLLGSSTTDLTSLGPDATSSRPFDAIVAIGVLIKGETMHFEYIADAVSQGLMRVGLDLGIPVIFGVLTVLNDDQAKARAGLLSGSHNHGEDWGLAAVELGVKRAAWAQGKLD